tara:strand:+ start:56 stop:256 length:201 start_codon:yes stop_codon:yes gene_type:complete
VQQLHFTTWYWGLSASSISSSIATLAGGATLLLLLLPPPLLPPGGDEGAMPIPSIPTSTLIVHVRP